MGLVETRKEILPFFNFTMVLESFDSFNLRPTMDWKHGHMQLSC